METCVALIKLIYTYVTMNVNSIHSGACTYSYCSLHILVVELIVIIIMYE